MNKQTLFIYIGIADILHQLGRWDIKVISEFILNFDFSWIYSIVWTVVFPIITLGFPFLIDTHLFLLLLENLQFMNS